MEDKKALVEELKGTINNVTGIYAKEASSVQLT